ncbi:MAG: sigma-70 family RNA polymerase sigma factor [Clostridia bacterium]|nr:sigma-70 family RNA polymerase sigma factor [Clostridia bacterium]
MYVHYAEEISQETFLKAIKGIKNFQNNSDIYTWLCKIAKNSWNNYLKRERKFVQLNEEILFSLEFENEAKNLENKQEVLEIYKIIHNLEPMTKEIMLLRLHSDLTFKEIGNLFGKSEQWAKTKYYRGKIKIREELQNKSDNL